MRDTIHKKRPTAYALGTVLRKVGVFATLTAVLMFQSPAVFANETLYQYHPDSFSGFSWGCDSGCATFWDQAQFRWFPVEWSAIDKFCFDMTFTYADQVSGTVKFTATPQYYDIGVWDYTSLVQDILLHGTTGWFDWVNDLPDTGSWNDVPSNFTTKSWDAYWTPSTSGSGTTRDNVCFDIAADLGTSLGLPSKYPMRVLVTMAYADRNDCRRDLGNNSRCYLYNNYSSPYSSQSIGFTFHNDPLTTNRNALMAGEITGWAAKTIYVYGIGGGTDLQNFPASTSYGFETRDFGVLGNMIRDVVVWAFDPNPDDVPDFGQLASAIQNKPPIGYWNLVKNNLTGMATSSYSDLDQAYASIRAIADPLKTGIAWVLWFAALYYLYRRITHIQL